ncbi:MAG: alpha-amylase family glycosyl hydrolase [Sphingobacteriaceae bacterium]|nr:alpha-amylase family glycosyl hydrolase [Sphingobacteriaceae bacterium]
MKYPLTTLFLGVLTTFLITTKASCQVVRSFPLFPSDNDNVTIYFDASQGNGALAGVAPPIYAHTGVLTNISTGPTDWRHVQGIWGQASPTTLMTPLGNNLYSITFVPRTFYNVPASETIQSLAFVFRNTNGSIVGRALNGSDIYLPLFAAGQLHSRIFTPAATSPLVNVGSSIPFFGAASQSCTLSLLVNGALQQTAIADTLRTNLTFNSAGNYQIIFIANNGTTQKADTLNLVALPNTPIQPLPAGIREGINYINDTTVTLALYAPLKTHAFAIGDFCNWELDVNYFMNRTPDSNWYWLTITGLTPAEEYAFQYLIDGSLRVADPFAEKVLDPWNDRFISSNTYPNLKPYPANKTSGIVSVFQTAQSPYVWQTNNFQRPANKDLIIYELLVRDFTTDQRYRSVIDSLDYLKRLGINCIGLMPIMEFEGNNSWGYNPSFYLAPDKAYGTANDLKALIDSCHSKGIAVVLDMVLNHAFGQSPLVQMWWDAANNRPATNSPYFNPVPTHDFNVGYDFNHETAATKRLVQRVVKHWLEAYRFDGYRFDLSKGFTQRNTLGNVNAWGQYDSSRVEIWKAIHDSMQLISPGSYVILEHFADNQEERVLTNHGMMTWGNINHAFNEGTMGRIAGSNFLSASYKSRGFSLPHLVSYAESHDEERLMFRNLNFGLQNGSYNTRDIQTALKRMELAAVFLMAIPGPKLIWQFGELGYDFSINRCPNGTINNNCRTDPKPVRWDYFVNPDRRYLYNIYAAMNHLKTSEAAFGTDTFFLNVGAAYKQMRLQHPSTDVVVVGNWGLVLQESTTLFTKTGTWYEYFTGDSIEVTNIQTLLALNAGEYRLYTTKRMSPPNLTLNTSEPKPVRAQLVVYPNPAQDQALIRLTNLKLSSEHSIFITDIQGKLVREISIPTANPEALISWDLTNAAGHSVPNGMYFIRTTTGDFGKVIIQK